MAGKIRKLIGTLLLITALGITQIPSVELSAASSAEFQIDHDTLVKYTGTASSVTVPANVKVIGAAAFADNTTITAVSLGKNVTEIEYDAFKNCTYLSKINFPESLEKVGNGAFENNISLKSVSINKNLKSLGTGVFAGCHNLSSITMDKDNSSFAVDHNGLYDKEKTKLYYYIEGSKAKSYVMPSSVENIGEYAFWGNENLKDITLSTNLKEISGYAFSNCKQLEGIVIPYSVNSIDPKAFENCINLQDVEIPASVSYIHDTAFDGCPKLNIIATPGSYAFQYYENWKLSNGSVIQDGITEGDTVVDESGKVYVVGSNGQLVAVEKDPNKYNQDGSYEGTAMYDPSNVDYIPQNDPATESEDGVIGKTIVVGQSAVLMMDPYTQYVTVLENREVLPEEEQEALNSTLEFDSIPDSGSKNHLPKFEIVDDKISSYAYYGQQNLSTYSIPRQITGIGEFAFARSGLESLVIPKGVKEIGYAAFYHCDQLKEISIPETVTWIEPSAFSYTAWLSNWANNENNDDFLIVGDHILLAYKGNRRFVEIPAGVKRIAPSCFQGHDEIEGVSIPDSVSIIGEEAFLNCTNLQQMHGGNQLIQIQDRAFKNTGLKSLIIADTVKTIGVEAFNCEDGQDSRKVIFQGQQLPKLSYTKRSTRMRENGIWNPAFTGGWTALLKGEGVSLEGTIFEEDGLGFTGDIITQDGERITTIKQITQMGNRVTVNSSSPQIPSDSVVTQFSYPGEYYLEIKEEENTLLESAFQRIYGDNIPQMFTFDMSLYNKNKDMKYTNFESKPLVVAIPIPNMIKGSTLHVVTVDQDGQLETLAYTITSFNDKDYIQFSTNHLSLFAIYALGDDGLVSIENGNVNINDSTGKKDISPNTGDNSISPKWVMVVGLSALALALIFYKPKRRKIK